MSESSPKTLFFVAGEASGDLHTAHLVDALRKIFPQFHCCGLGGPLMRAAGVTLFHELTKHAAVGLTEVLIRYPFFHRIFHDGLRKVREIKPAAVILTDFPGFNLRFAKEVKKLGIPVIYYISPQVWAWKRKRIYSIPQYVDKMLVILPFEKDLYPQSSMEVTFVGHPLVDEVHPSAAIHALKKEFGVCPQEKIITLLPGSRRNEVLSILPIMAKTAALLHETFPEARFLIAKTAALEQSLYNQILMKCSFPYTMIENRVYDCFAISQFALVKSGTSTLEATIAGIPYALIYKVNPITYAIGKRLVTIPFLGIANIIAGKEIIPEFIQHTADPKKIAAHVVSVLTDTDKRNFIIEGLTYVKEALGPGKASLNAARAILEFLKKRGTLTFTP